MSGKVVAALAAVVVVGGGAAAYFLLRNPSGSATWQAEPNQGSRDLAAAQTAYGSGVVAGTTGPAFQVRTGIGHF
jgi:hypothetical protein